MTAVITNAHNNNINKLKVKKNTKDLIKYNTMHHSDDNDNEVDKKKNVNFDAWAHPRSSPACLVVHSCVENLRVKKRHLADVLHLYGHPLTPRRHTLDVST